jgi:subtilisin family serine protease
MASRMLTIFLTLLTLALAAPSPSPRKGHFMGVPVSNPELAAADIVANRYIVVYNSTVGEEAISAHQSKWTAKIAASNVGKRGLDGRSLSTKVRTVRIGSWNAMALEADDRTMNQIFDADEVSYIEADARVRLSALSTQGQATSGLARISHAGAGKAGYVFDATAGEGITAFVVDTGIRVTHSEFQGRATFAANFANNVVSCLLTQTLNGFVTDSGGCRTPTKTATAAM